MVTLKCSKFYDEAGWNDRKCEQQFSAVRVEIDGNIAHLASFSNFKYYKKFLCGFNYFTF